jgi:electron transport complex protein RnfE
MGLGFTWAILLVSTIREMLGSGTLLGYSLGRWYQPASVMIMAPGAFIVLGLLLGYFQWRRSRAGARALPQATPVRTSKEDELAVDTETAAQAAEG